MSTATDLADALVANDAARTAAENVYRDAITLARIRHAVRPVSLNSNRILTAEQIAADTAYGIARPPIIAAGQALIEQVRGLCDCVPEWPQLPGVVVDELGLARMETGLRAGQQPWVAAYQGLLNGGSRDKTLQRNTSKKFSALDWDPWNPGTIINRNLGGSPPNNEVAMFRDDSIAALVQALLWRATGTSQYLTNVQAILTAYSGVTSFEADSAESRRLNAGWACDNFTQALSITGLRPPAFVTFLTDVCLPLLDWPNNPNWWASFTASQVGIGVIAEDLDVYEAGVAYFDRRVRDVIYHEGYDGPTVHSIDGNVGRTVTNWYGQVDTSLSAAGFDDGRSGEFNRDLEHTMFGLSGFIHAASTIVAQGGTLAEETRDRLVAAYEFQAPIEHDYLLNGVPISGAFPTGFGQSTAIGGTGHIRGWLPALRLFGAAVVPNVAALCELATIENPGAGTCHQIAEGLKFAP